VIRKSIIQPIDGRHLRLSAVVLLASAAVVVTSAGPANGSAIPADNAARHGSAAAWVERPPLAYARQGLDVAVVNGRILALGGFANPQNVAFNYVEARRTRGDGRWRTLAPLPTPRANLATATLRGIVYAVGGIGEDTTDVVERYDSRAGTWGPSGRLPQPRDSAGAAALGGLLYVAGGFVGGSETGHVTASMIAYDPTHHKWRIRASMPSARLYLRLVAAGRHLYAIGGQSAPGGEILTTVERYDPKSDTWRTMASMNESRRLPGVVALRRGSGRFIVAVGGGSGTESDIVLRRTTEVYDISSGRWTVIRARLPHGRGSLVAATEADGTLLAIGGATDNGITGGPRITTAEVLALRLSTHDLRGHRQGLSLGPLPGHQSSRRDGSFDGNAAAEDAVIGTGGQRQIEG
jgi:hypothetical protein